MADAFYLQLVSNANPNLYPDNTTTTFSTELPRRITLSGEYECALLEIQIPCTVSNVRQGDNVIPIKNTTDCITVPPGYYANREILTATLNRLLKEKKLCDEDFFLLRGDGIVETNPVKRKKAEVPTCQVISLPETMRLQLGFNEKEFDCTKKIYGAWPADPDIGAPSQIYVYCDFVAPQMVGHTLAPILRTVPLRKGELFASTLTHSVKNPIYLGLSTREISTAEVYLRDHAGRSIPFQFGQSSLLVHFRRRT